MPSHSLGKKARIYLRSELQHLFASQGSFVSYPFRVIYTQVPRQGHPLKMMVSVSKKRLTHATDRNRIKRLTREAYRLHSDKLLAEWPDDSTLLIGFIYLRDKLSSYKTVERAINEAFVKLQNTKENSQAHDQAKADDETSD